MKLDRYEEKLDYLMSAGPKVDLSNRYITDMCISFYDKLKGLFEYRIAEVKLRSKVTLFKAKTALSLNATADYGLSKICQENVEVHTVEGNHVTILENDDLAMKINEILDK